MRTRRIGGLGAVVTVLALVTTTVPGALFERAVDGWLEGASNGPLPLLGSIGQTVSAYSYGISAVEAFLPLALGVGLGVWLPYRVSADELPTALRAIAVGSAAVVAVPAIPVAVVWAGLDLAELAMLGGLVAEFAVKGPLQVTVAAAGGITLSQFGFLGENRPTPTAGDVSTRDSLTGRD